MEAAFIFKPKSGRSKIYCLGPVWSVIKWERISKQKLSWFIVKGSLLWHLRCRSWWPTVGQWMREAQLMRSFSCTRQLLHSLLCTRDRCLIVEIVEGVWISETLGTHPKRSATFFYFGAWVRNCEYDGTSVNARSICRVILRPWWTRMLGEAPDYQIKKHGNSPMICNVGIISSK